MRKRSRRFRLAASVLRPVARSRAFASAFVFAFAFAFSLPPDPASAHGPIDEEIRRASAEIAASPTRGESWLRRAELHRLHRDWAAARLDYSRAEELSPHLSTIALARGTMELEVSEPEAAAAEFRRYLRDRPDDALGRFLLGRALGDQGQVEAAVHEMDAAIARMPQPETGHFLARARLCAAASDRGFERALDGLSLARERKGLVPTLEVYAAQLEAALGRRADARARLRELRPLYADARAWEAVATDALGTSEIWWPDADAAAHSTARRFESFESPGSEDPIQIDLATPLGLGLGVGAPARSGRPAGDTADTAAAVAAVAAVATVTRGPYIQRATPTSLRLRWRTDIATNRRVIYGPSPDQLIFSVSILSTSTEHEVTMQGLSPDTRYYYAIGTTTEILAGGDSTYSFTTHPIPGATGPCRFWFLGDSGGADDAARAVRDAYYEYTGDTRTNAWFMLGDNAYDAGTDSEYQAAVFEMYPEMLRSACLWATRGNHDTLHAGANNDYYEIFTFPAGGESGGLPSGSEAYYAFDYANIHFVCLDSEGSELAPGGVMLDWLEQDLAATNQEWKIVYWHHSPYSHGSHDSDDPQDSGGRLQAMRENAVPICEQAGVDLVLTGHSHSYERSFLLDGHYGASSTLTPAMILDDGDGRPFGDGAYEKPSIDAPHEGTVYNVTGCSSRLADGPLDHPAMYIDFKRLGSLVLDVNGLELNAAFIDSSGVVRDRFTMRKGTASDAPDTTPRTPASLLRAVEPNPFAAEARIRFALPTAMTVRVTISDIEGRRVRTLLDDHRPPGPVEITWDGLDDRGRVAPAGAYFVRLEHASGAESRRFVRLR